MHSIEPHYNWRHLYIAAEDDRSPFFGREYSEFEFTHAVYDHYIHPQWDEIGSSTVFVKLLYSDYDEGFVIIEMIGEWNDILHNDIMVLKRELFEPLMEEGINKFILLGENILNFHGGDDDYYDEWFDEVEDGWIVAINFRQHVKDEFYSSSIDQYIAFSSSLDAVNWRTMKPQSFYLKIKKQMQNRLEGI